MQDQKDPTVGYILTLFESEAKAREREQDPRRAEGQQAMNDLMSTILVSPPQFTDMTVTAEWAP